MRERVFTKLGMAIAIVRGFHLSNRCGPRGFLRACESDVRLRLHDCGVLRCGVFERTRVSFPKRGSLRVVLPSSMVTERGDKVLVRCLRGIFYREYKVSLGIRLRFERARRDGCHGGTTIRVTRRIRGMVHRTGLGDGGRRPTRSRRTKATRGGTRGGASGKRRRGGSGGTTFTSHGSGEGKSFQNKFEESDGPSIVCKESFRKRPITLRAVANRVNRIVIHKRIVRIRTERVHGRGAVLVFPVASFASDVIIGVFLHGRRIPRIARRMGGKTFLGFHNIAAMSHFSDRLAVTSVTKVGGVTGFAATEMSADPRGEMRLRYRAGVDSVSKIASTGSLIGHTCR